MLTAHLKAKEDQPEEQHLGQLQPGEAQPGGRRQGIAGSVKRPAAAVCRPVGHALAAGAVAALRAQLLRPLLVLLVLLQL